MKELESIITADLKKYFGLSENATDVELSEAIQNSTSNKRDDVAIEMVSQIAELVKMETDKQVTEFTSKLEADYKSIVETLQSKVEELNTKIDSIKDGEESTEVFDFDSKIEALKIEFGKQLNEIKAGKNPTTEGSAKVIETHKRNGSPVGELSWGAIK